MAKKTFDDLPEPIRRHLRDMNADQKMIKGILEGTRNIGEPILDGFLRQWREGTYKGDYKG